MTASMRIVSVQLTIFLTLRQIATDFVPCLLNEELKQN